MAQLLSSQDHPTIPNLQTPIAALDDYLASAPPDIALVWRIIRADYENMARVIDGLVPATTADGLGQVWRRVGEGRDD